MSPHAQRPAFRGVPRCDAIEPLPESMRAVRVIAPRSMAHLLRDQRNSI